ncbi:MAG: deoxyribose-phosphate aldolase [Tissierellia bacterium]|nr:deoxyribose-phosphate aldolase [Tissierellia bacterium]
MDYSIKQLAKFIDHTNLKADASVEDIKKLCQEAKKYGFKMVAINQVQTSLCRDELKDTDVNVGAAIAFPLGQTSISAKLYETEDAINNGADEIDYVINITEVKNGNFNYIEEEMKKMVALCRRRDVICKVIFENCYLEKEEIRKLAEIAKDVKPDFIKTSTGFGPSGATFEDVKLMLEVVGDEVKVKAAGGIRTMEDFLKYVEIGVGRIGTSSGIKIIDKLIENNN